MIFDTIEDLVAYVEKNNIRDFSTSRRSDGKYVLVILQAEK